MKQDKEIPTQTPLVEFSAEKMKKLIKSFTPEKLASFLGCYRFKCRYPITQNE